MKIIFFDRCFCFVVLRVVCQRTELHSFTNWDF